MTWAEGMECKFALLFTRVVKLESLVRSLQASGAGAGEACAVARDVGLDPDILVQPLKIVERRRLGIELRRRGWTFAKISKVMSCQEKSVRRWCAAVNDGELKHHDLDTGRLL